MTESSGTSVSVDTTRNGVDAVVGRFLEERSGSRGVEAYEWLVATLRSVPGSISHVITVDDASAVVTTCNHSTVIHSLVGPDERRAILIEHARASASGAKIRGLALPGDRMTKNLFEEARMPAQILVH